MISEPTSEGIALEASSSAGLASNLASTSKSLESLGEEKKNLHAYLKAYERYHYLNRFLCYFSSFYFMLRLFRDFNRLNGRPVMRPEDIQPVAHEYERYKVCNLYHFAILIVKKFYPCLLNRM